MSEVAADPETKPQARASRQPVRKGKRNPPPAHLNVRQTKFVNAILLGASGGAAVRKAGYKDVKDPYAAASELRKNP
jgi:hypothetical protein